MKGQPDNPDASRTSMASTRADFRELKANSNATVQELQEFLRELRGKSPQEMLGVVASSQLFRATILSVILVTAALFALTAIPYFLGDKPDEPTSIQAEAVTKILAPTPQPAETKPAETEKPAAIAPLGINEKLPAPANSNPLEDKGEDFLKDLE